MIDNVMNNYHHLYITLVEVQVIRTTLNMYIIVDGFQ